MKCSNRWWKPVVYLFKSLNEIKRIYDKFGLIIKIWNIS